MFKNVEGSINARTIRLWSSSLWGLLCGRRCCGRTTSRSGSHLSVYRLLLLTYSLFLITYFLPQHKCFLISFKWSELLHFFIWHPFFIFLFLFSVSFFLIVPAVLSWNSLLKRSQVVLPIPRTDYSFVHHMSSAYIKLWVRLIVSFSRLLFFAPTSQQSDCNYSAIISELSLLCRSNSYS